MLRYYYLLFIFYPSLCTAKEHVNCMVANAITKQSVPYATIAAKNRIIGTYTNEKGYFDRSIFNETDTLVIKCIGYTTLEMPYKTLQNIIHLQPRTQILNEVLVKPNKSEPNVIPYEVKKGTIKWSSKAGIELITRVSFPDYAQNPKKIMQVRIQMKKFDGKNPCRLHIYSSTSDNIPGEELLTENILVTKDCMKGTEFVKNLSNKIFRTSCNSIFVGIEWIGEVKGINNIVISENKKRLPPYLLMTEAMPEAKTYTRTVFYRDWVLLSEPITEKSNPPNMLVSVSYQ